MSYVEMDKELDYQHPFLVLSDNNNICQRWDNALENTQFKDIYSNFSEEDQSKIQGNLKNRTCQMIDNVNKCFTTNGQLETCNKLPDEDPKNIREIMSKIDTIAQNKKNEILIKLKRIIDKKRLTIDSLINQYASRKTMINMNEGYKAITNSSITKNQEINNDLSNEIDSVDNLKEFATNDNYNIRNTIKWYSEKNNFLKYIIKILLIIMILVNTLFILNIQLN
jgi:hypothetical protein